MERRTRGRQDCLPHGLSIEDLKLVRWFLHILINERRVHLQQAGRQDDGMLHSHAVDLEEPDGQSGRRLTSLAALFHQNWPQVPVKDLLMALARVGFITPPQDEPDGYTFRLRSDCQDLPAKPQDPAPLPEELLKAWQDYAEKIAKTPRPALWRPK